MKLEQFKKIKNKKRPEFCFSYKLIQNDKKIEIFTMNGGHSFLASICSMDLTGKYRTDFSSDENSIDDALTVINRHLNS